MSNSDTLQKEDNEIPQKIEKVMVVLKEKNKTKTDRERERERQKTYLLIRLIMDCRVTKSGRSFGSSLQHRWIMFTIADSASSQSFSSKLGRKPLSQT